MLSRVVQVLQVLRRKAVQRPRITGLVAVFLLTALPYLILWRLHMGKFGRWYWNYGVAFHPILVSLLPSGDWSGVKNPPRWVQEIHDSPWMGEWPMPLLTKPKYDEHGKLTSPVIAKLHVFSTVQEKARQKRKLIRQLTVLDQIPEEYRHLIEIKFVMGHAYKENWEVDQEMEDLLKLEQEEHGDLIRLSLVHGENLREGKILDWMHAAGSGEDGGRPGWWTFKVDDDTVLNLPNFLDHLLSLDPHRPTYVGTSLNRWPDFHYHFTGLTTGFNWGLLKTLSAGIGKMTRQEIEVWWDDDVLTGELMFCLPSGPQCRRNSSTTTLPAYCDARATPTWGWDAPPPNPDPRTSLYWYDFLRHMGERDVWFLKNDVARHSWFFKSNEGYEKEWRKKIKGKMWTPPRWLERYKEEK